MSEKIDAREVLAYLNELGYTNINAQQLKDFIKDLKKLMKYENKHQKDTSDIENVNPNINEETEYNFNENIGTSESLYDQPTIASKAKEIPRKEKQISVQITKKKLQVDHPHCIHLLNPSNVQENIPNLKFIKTTDISEHTTESTLKSVRSESKQSATSKQSSQKEPKSRVTFIRPVISKPSINKCDPVALYHHYQTEWKRVKIPGQDSRADLRWAIREKMLGEPKVPPRPVSRKSNFR